MLENESPPRSKSTTDRARVEGIIDAFAALNHRDFAHLTGKSLQTRLRPTRHSMVDMESQYEVRTRQSHS